MLLSSVVLKLINSRVIIHVLLLSIVEHLSIHIKLGTRKGLQYSLAITTLHNEMTLEK